MDGERKLEGLVDETLKFLWKDDPVFATACGIHDHDDQLGQLSSEAIDQHISNLHRFVTGLEQLTEDLSPDEEADRKILLARLNSSILDWEIIGWHQKEPALYLDHALYGAYLLIARDFAPFHQRMECLRKRLLDYRRLLNEAKRNLIPKATPAVYLDSALETLEGAKMFLSVTVPEVTQKITDQPLQRALLSAIDDASLALNEFGEWLKQNIAPYANADFAVGRQVFEKKLKCEHLLTETIEQLEEMAYQVLSQTKASLDDVAKRIDPSKPWFLLLEDLKHQHPPKERIVQHYAEEVAKARQFVSEKCLVSLPEWESLRVVETPAFDRVTIPYAAYVPIAPFDEQSEGLFYVTPINPEEPDELIKERLLGHCIFALPITVVHEAYPGHHLQLSISARLPSKVRRVFSNNLFVEGWALYCEELMLDSGYTDDLRVRLFQLKDLIWRAVRVIIDVGLHCKGMSFIEAVQLLVNEAHLEKSNAEAEVKRYTVSPTQPLSYLTGKMAILRLRQEAQKREGKEFSVKRFHDRLLQIGGLPIQLVEELFRKDNRH